MPFTPEDFHAIRLTLALAALTTALLLVLATPLAWWLAHTTSRWRAVVVAGVAMPLVLPPTVLGFYLLMALGTHGWIGQFTQWLGWGLLSFSFPGLLIGSMLYSLPFAVQPVQQAFEAMGKRPMEVAATLRASPLKAFFTIAVPQARAGFLLAGVLTFAHTVGEFGVVLMVGGNIPGSTRVVSTQMYAYVETMQYQQAHWLAGLMVAFSFITLLVLSRWHRRTTQPT